MRSCGGVFTIDSKGRFPINKVLLFLLAAIPVLGLLFFGALNPPKAEAVPSYARQTGLACSGCHYTPPELNPAGRRFKLLGYVDRADETKVVKADGGKKRAALDLLASLPLSVMLDASFTSTKSPVPAFQNGTPTGTSQNGSVEFPQDISLFLSGAWTSHIGSFLQVTYDTQDDHFSMDNTDIRFARTTKLGGKELVYGLDLNNNPTVEDLWNSTPAWAYPWIASDFAPTPNASAIINGGLAQDVGGFGAYGMWNNHLYLDLAIYRSDHVGTGQPNTGAGAGVNIRGVAPYWRLAWQQLTGKTQYEVGTYGMHMRSTPGAITNPDGSSFPVQDSYTDWAVDTQIDRTLFRTDVLSFRATYIRENNDLLGSLSQGLVSQGSHRLNTVLANVEYHLGNKYTGTLGWFNTTGTSDPTLYPPSVQLTGNFNGDPRGAGYIANFTYWPWQNLLLGLQYTGYTRFNGASTNYDGFGRNANANNTIYLDAKIIF
jgi:hypothetical protein